MHAAMQYQMVCVCVCVCVCVRVRVCVRVCVAQEYLLKKLQRERLGRGLSHVLPQRACACASAAMEFVHLNSWPSRFVPLSLPLAPLPPPPVSPPSPPPPHVCD